MNDNLTEEQRHALLELAIAVARCLRQGVAAADVSECVNACVVVLERQP